MFVIAFVCVFGFLWIIERQRFFFEKKNQKTFGKRQKSCSA
jgi:hypothetical protein